MNHIDKIIQREFSAIKDHGAYEQRIYLQESELRALLLEAVEAERKDAATKASSCEFVTKAQVREAICDLQDFDHTLNNMAQGIWPDGRTADEDAFRSLRVRDAIKVAHKYRTKLNKIHHILVEFHDVAIAAEGK